MSDEQNPNPIKDEEFIKRTLLEIESGLQAEDLPNRIGYQIEGWDNIEDKPEKFPPEDHLHSEDYLTKKQLRDEGAIDGRYYTEIEVDELITRVRDVWIPSSGIRSPGTKPATWKEWGISGVWEFSDATDDTLVANIKFPNDMDLTVAPTITIGWSTNTAVTTETATWQLEYLYTAPGEDTTAAAQATITVNSNAIAQADGLIVVSFPTLAVPGATDVCVHMRLKRLGAGGDDDLTDTAELHGLCMSYVSDKRGTAL